MPKTHASRAKRMMKDHGIAGHLDICRREEDGKGFHIEFSVWTSDFNLAYLNHVATTFMTQNLEVSMGSGCDCGCGGESTLTLRSAVLFDAS